MRKLCAISFLRGEFRVRADLRDDFSGSVCGSSFAEILEVAAEDGAVQGGGGVWRGESLVPVGALSRAANPLSCGSTDELVPLRRARGCQKPKTGHPLHVRRAREARGGTAN